MKFPIFDGQGTAENLGERREAITDFSRFNNEVSTTFADEPMLTNIDILSAKISKKQNRPDMI